MGTVDVLLAIMVTLLVYTNAGVPILTEWWVEKWEDSASGSGATPCEGEAVANSAWARELLPGSIARVNSWPGPTGGSIQLANTTLATQTARRTN